MLQCRVCGGDSCMTWVQVGRHGAMMAGCQVRPGANGCLGNPAALIGTDPWRLWTELRGASSLAIAYSPASSTPGAACDAPRTQLASGICVPVPMRFFAATDATGCTRTVPTCSRSAGACCPRAGRGAFTTALELKEQQRLVLSFYYHMARPARMLRGATHALHGIHRCAACFAQAAQRLCRNPLEDESVVGITNYINIGLQARVRLAAP